MIHQTAARLCLHFGPSPLCAQCMIQTKKHLCTGAIFCLKLTSGALIPKAERTAWRSPILGSLTTPLGTGCCSKISLEPSFIQAEQSQLSQPFFFIGEVLQSSKHLPPIHLILVQLLAESTELLAAEAGPCLRMGEIHPALSTAQHQKIAGFPHIF